MAVAEDLTLAIQAMIQENVTKTKPRPDVKRWWNRELRKMKREFNKLRYDSFRNSHEELRHKSNQFREEIVQAKHHHWSNYLEEMTAAGIWVQNKFIREPVGNGSWPRIPTLKVINQEGEEGQRR